MKLAMEQLNIHPNFGAFEDHMEMYEISTMNKECIEDVHIVTYFFTFIVKESYSLLRLWQF